MAAARKLQAEIDKTLKRVDEGCKLFDDLLEKIADAPNVNQKEKLENELKKEIKKLQRLRDQIKNWQTNSDIKDKAPIGEARRQIENQMEKFKLVEKETKTKAYSKEGLVAARMDPQEKEKLELINWLNEMIAELRSQIDQRECELETLNGGGKKSKKSDKDKLENTSRLKEGIERHNFHMEKLELIMRFLNNDMLSPDDVNVLKEEVEYYVNCNNDPEFVINESVYDDLVFPDEGFVVAPVGLTTATSVNSTYTTQNSTSLDDNDYIPSSSSSSTNKRSVSTTNHSTSEADNGVDVGSTTSPPPTSPSPATVTTGPSRSKKATPAALTSSVSVPSRSQSTTTAMTTKHKSESSSEPNAPLPTAFSAVAQQSLSSASVSSSSTNAPTAAASSKNVAAPAPMSFSAAASATPVVSTSPTGFAPPAAPTYEPITVLNGTTPSNVVASNTNGGLSPPTTISPSPPDVESRSVLSHYESFLNHPPGVGTNPSSCGTPGAEPPTRVTVKFHPMEGLAPLGKVPLLPEHRWHLEMLDSAFRSMPEPSDTIERTKPFWSRAYAPTPPHFPHTPPENSNSLEYFKKLTPDTLFFLFYYAEGTRAQILAAQALKLLFWRYHTNFRTWFQRAAQPSQIETDYEKGKFSYFDLQSWSIKTKEDFKFEYKFLEDLELSKY